MPLKIYNPLGWGVYFRNLLYTTLIRWEKNNSNNNNNNNNNMHYILVPSISFITDKKCNPGDTTLKNKIIIKNKIK